jgi:hypothetical protein
LSKISANPGSGSPENRSGVLVAFGESIMSVQSHARSSRPFVRTFALAAAIGAALGSVSPAQAQVGVQVIINLPSIGILYYRELITVNIPSSALAPLYSNATACPNNAGVGPNTGCPQGAVTVPPASVNYVSPNIVANVGLPSPLNPTPTTPTAIPLVLQQVWAVRAIHNNNVTVTAGLGTGLPLNNAGPPASSINVVNATASPGSFPPPGMVNAQQGDVTLVLDLTNAFVPGNYSNPAATYTLTLALP